MYKYFYLLLSMFVSITLTAQPKSPKDFLGYELGSQYTPHHKIVDYFSHIAATVPTMVKYDTYGSTNEGRPLTIAYVSTPENIQRLEAIRQNNLRLANLSKDRAAAIEDNAPAIVWLSYNVHGNEASSSESAMKMLYELVNPNHTKTKEYLKNTVVIIDPCLNPDGRDRYVNWFKSVVGKNINPELISREHHEPWPGGRTNHYYFDLNRDWAWQTQVESSQRAIVYQQWMPQIHVDYHEQGINSPYYFAPAAEPFHEVITPWQREFQTQIGKNNAKHFDEQGWLYFTKQYFDLFYPSYGDTYPTYNGAIGMTYEQAGHSTSGAAVINAEGDTLTLTDRLTHHYVAGISTLEMAAKNAPSLIKEYRKFFNEAVSSGVGEYKSYVIKSTPTNANQINAIKKLFDKNGIQYGSSSGAAAGYNYATGKEDKFSVAAEDLVVSAIQPRSALVKVLLEPKSKLTDSATYDITAWSLPYAYGLPAFATKTSLTVKQSTENKVVNTLSTTYGFAYKWNDLQSAKLTGKLLQKGIKLRVSSEPFELNGEKFDRGTIIILKTSNQALGNTVWEETKKAANEENVKLYAIHSGFVDKGFDFGSDKVSLLTSPRVVLLMGDGVYSNGVGEIWHFLDKQLDYPVTVVDVEQFGRLSLDNYDVLILANGRYNFLRSKETAQPLKDWVSKGGKIIAFEGAISGLAAAEFGISAKKEAENAKENDEYEALKKYTDRDRAYIGSATYGSIYKVELDNTHPLAFGYPDYYYTLKYDNSIYDFFDGNGWNVGIIKKDNQVAGFVGTKLKEKLKDGMLFGSQPYGRGNITYFVDNVLFRNFWENGKLMFCNALFFSGL